MKSVMRHRFSEVPDVKIPRSSFDRSHGVKTTFDAGWLVPFLVDEALPGDTFQTNLTGFARLSTPTYPRNRIQTGEHDNGDALTCPHIHHTNKI